MKRNRWKPSLPEEVKTRLTVLRVTGEDEALADYISALRGEGWSLAAIAEPVQVSRERIRQLSDVDEYDTMLRTRRAVARGEALPRVTTKPVIEKIKPPVIEPNMAVVERLREIQPLAQSVRGNSPRYRREAEEYSRLVAEQLARGVRVKTLAELLEVSYSALKFRLVRYGYVKSETTSPQSVYRPILERNRVR